MRVFNRKCINRLKKKYKNKSRYIRPSVFGLAIESRFSQERKKIEKWFKELPENVKPDMMARLQSESKQQHFGAYYELVTWEFFKKLGYTVEIHPSFGKEKPDLSISGIGLKKPLIIEVATVFDDPEWEKEDQKLSKLLGSLDKLQHYYFLGITVNSVPIPDIVDYDSLLQFVSRWFDSFDPQITESVQEVKYIKDDLNLSLTLIPKKERARKKKGSIIGSFMLPPRFIGHRQLRNSLKMKACKYDFIKKQSLPYIIAISLFDSNSDNEDVIAQMFGKEALTIFRNAEGHVVSKEWGRDSSGICKYNRNTRLSGVITIESESIRYTSTNWLIKKFVSSIVGDSIGQKFSDIFKKIIRVHRFSLIHNPYRAVQIQDDFMNGYKQFKKTEERAKSYTLSWVNSQVDLPFER